jgi:hypothetical protein
MGFNFHDPAARGSSFKDFEIWPVIAISWHKTLISLICASVLKVSSRVLAEGAWRKMQYNHRELRQNALPRVACDQDKKHKSAFSMLNDVINVG